MAKKKQRKAVAPAQPPLPAPKKIRWDIIIAIVALLASVAFGVPALLDHYKTPKQKFDEENKIVGDLRPDPIPLPIKDYILPESKLKYINTLKDAPPEIKGIYLPYVAEGKPYVFIFMGGIIQPLYFDEAFDGVDIFSTVRHLDSSYCVESHLYIGVYKNRMYASVEFKDLQNEQTIGKIMYNHWELYKANMLDFYSDDKHLEVRDKQNNIVFSLDYFAGAVEIAGYFIGINTATVIGNAPRSKAKLPYACFDKSDINWKAKVAEQVQYIKPIVPYPY